RRGPISCWCCFEPTGDGSPPWRGHMIYFVAKGRLCRFLLARRLLPLVRIEDRLADADVLRGHLDHLVVVDIGDRLFERHALRRGQADRVVLARRTEVGEL